MVTTQERAVWVQRVVSWVDDHEAEVIADLQELVRVPSVSGTQAEHEIQALLADRFGGLGFEVDHWEAPLVDLVRSPAFPGMEVERTTAWGLVGAARGLGNGPSLMLNGHVDVVPTGDLSRWPSPDPFDGRLADGAVHGRGACDMKGGLTAAIWAVRAVTELAVPLSGDLLLAAVQGEEDGGMGTFALLERGWRADACVIPEPTSLDIAPANGGSLTFRLRVTGLAAHGSLRTSGVSALEMFWPVFRALRDLEALRNQRVDPIMARWDVAYPIEVGTVRAGDWASSVPDLLVAEGRYGVALDENVAQARAVFEDAVARACAADPWLSFHPVEIDWWGGVFASSRLPEGSTLADRVSAAHAAVSSRPQQRWGAPYGSDLRLMTELAGVPTVHYGPGDPGLAHGPLEKVPVEEVLTVAKALAVLAIEHCGLSG
ncbi:MAG: ArgE/DapE family deacylase [Ornithinibacter sp.]